MNPALIAALKASARDFHSAAEAMTRGATRLDTLVATLEREMTGTPADDGVVSYKRPDGRLSEAGIAAVIALLEQNLPVTEIAAQLSIDVSAVSRRRKTWLAAQKSA